MLKTSNKSERLKAASPNKTSETLSVKMYYDKTMPAGQGVLSACHEQIALCKTIKELKVIENGFGKADIHHYHTINPPFFFSMLFRRFICRKPTVAYVHFLPETTMDSVRLNKLYRWGFCWYMLRFYNAAKSLVVVNPDFIDKLVAFGIKREKITYIPNFVSKETFYPLPDNELVEAKAKYTETPQFTVVSAGQLQTRKGVFDFAKIAEQLPDITFLWAGGFSFGSITQGYEEIQELLKDHPPNLKFVDIVPRAQMNTFLNAGDLFLLPSYAELFPMTILEALNIHIPIVLRDIPEYEHIMPDYALFAQTNEEFVEHVKRLHDNAEHYKQHASRSEAGSKFYSKERIADLWNKFYQRVKKR